MNLQYLGHPISHLKPRAVLWRGIGGFRVSLPYGYPDVPIVNEDRRPSDPWYDNHLCLYHPSRQAQNLCLGNMQAPHFQGLTPWQKKMLSVQVSEAAGNYVFAAYKSHLKRLPFPYYPAFLLEGYTLTIRNISKAPILIVGALGLQLVMT